MRLDEDGTLVLIGATGGRIVNALAPAAVAITHQPRFRRYEVKGFTVRLGVYEGPGTDDSITSQIRLCPV